MLHHLSIGVADLHGASVFYDAVLGAHAEEAVIRGLPA